MVGSGGCFAMWLFSITLNVCRCFPGPCKPGSDTSGALGSTLVGDHGIIQKNTEVQSRISRSETVSSKYLNYFPNSVHQGIVKKKCPDALHLYPHGLGMKLNPPSNMKRMRIGKRNYSHFILTGGTDSLWLLSNTVLCSCLRNLWYWVIPR